MNWTPSSPAGWLVDVTGSYMATFSLSGAAMVLSSIILSIVGWIRRCQRRVPAIAENTKHQPLPTLASDQSDHLMAVNIVASKETTNLIHGQQRRLEAVTS